MAGYTDKQIKYVLEEYKKVLDQPYEERTAVVEALAEELGVSVYSIRSLLVSHDVYRKKSYTTKRGKRPISKEDLVSKLENYLGIPGRLDSLSKANKTDIILLIKHYIKDRGDPEQVFTDFI